MQLFTFITEVAKVVFFIKLLSMGIMSIAETAPSLNPFVAELEKVFRFENCGSKSLRGLLGFKANIRITT